ncbi:AI-2E family transporter [Halomarina litorea]|uniref:AI-2E family transporter n=1 Tax=Halomarina litorea TaxID=2961595 RepID=UPI0020C4FF68|nr:AI-2E family transporter [Halomarina sp. BCD28]
MELPRLDRSRLAWGIVGLLLGVALLYVVYSFVGTFVFGVFIYYSTRPVYNRLKRRVYPPSLAAAISLFVLALPAILLFVYTLAIGIQEIARLLASGAVDLGPLEPLIERYLDISSIVEDPSSLLENPSLRDAFQAVFDQALGYVGFIGNALLHLFVMLAIAFYLLRDGPRLSRWVTGRFGDDRGVFEEYTRAVDTDLASVFFGNILNAIITGVIGALAYTMLNEIAPGVRIPYPTLLGLLTGVASLIPVVGMKLVYFPVTGYLVARAVPGGEGLWFAAVFFAVSFVVVDAVPDFVLRPYVSGRNLHIGMVMFAYIFGPLLFGWYGIFLGPVLLVLVFHFARIVLPVLFDGKPIRPYAVDPAAMTVESTEMDPGAPTPVDGATTDNDD